MKPSLGAVLRQARQVRGIKAVDAARSAGISVAYLGKLEADAVKKPSPPILHQLSRALVVPYDGLMRLAGYLVPGDSQESTPNTVAASLFADLTDDERDELLEYLAWYRSRHRSGRGLTEPAETPIGQD
jgi:HTH-type transcriptional regulator, competence development regulator